MMTLTAPAPRTIKAPIAQPRCPEAVRTKPARPGFWMTLLRALSVAAI
jgi:hypothetical protein